MTPVTKPTVDQSSASGRSLSQNVADLDSIQLLKGQRSVTIQHNGALYRLQATKLGKLILTK